MLGTTSVFLIARRHNLNFAKTVINSFGGEALLKHKCLETHSNNKPMTLNEILNFEKLCDCAVAHSYDIIIGSKEHFKKMDIHKIPYEIVESMHNLLLAQYDTCEIEMLNQMNKQYKTISPKN